jgi:phage FluMu gp28-like protein
LQFRDIEACTRKAHDYLAADFVFRAGQPEIANDGDTAGEKLLCIASAGSGAFLPTALIESRMDKDIPVL